MLGGERDTIGKLEHILEMLDSGIYDQSEAKEAILALFEETIEEVIGKSEPGSSLRTRMTKDGLRLEQCQRAHEILGKKE